MATFSYRESVLLGYSPQRSSTNHPISSPESLDIDFHDVFGGPPRRASTQEMRHSFGETTDLFALRSDKETSLHRHRWSGPSEKPVFGDESVNRRRYASDDFFDDIFRGGESLNSSPRKNDGDPFSSTPGSRVLSPARPLPPRASDPFASSSLPVQFSLPAKLIKGADLPTFGPSIRNHHRNKDGISNGVSFYSHSPLSRFSIQGQEEPGNDVSVKSSLSRELSGSNAELTGFEKSDEVDKGSNMKNDSNCSEATPVNHQFHFSIYKWASKGIPLALPFKGRYNSKVKDKFKFERSLSASRRIACEGMAKEFPAATLKDTDGVSSDAKSCEIELDKVEQKQPIQDSILHKSETEIATTHQEIVKDAPANVIFQDSRTQEASKTRIKTLRSLLSGTNELTVEEELEESKVKGTKKSAAVFAVGGKESKEDGKSNALNTKEMDKPKFQGFPTNSRDSPAKNQARGKVKEFVKIFNQETSEQPKFNETSQIRSSRWKERSKFSAQDVNKTSTRDAPTVVDEFLEKHEKHDSQASKDISSGLQDSSASSAGSEAVDGGHLDDSFNEKILIKELRQDEKEVPQDGDRQEEIRAIDAKIRSWCNGKEGNIRSLLSTLQYVLWPGSGWKPVPLVDIIEGNAVKRSYQKALLSLHPDKLQQKGATSHQKYIAEKVFDILQEAWTHFNSLGSV